MEGLDALRSFVDKHREEAPSLDDEAEEIDRRLREIYRRREAGRGSASAGGHEVVPRFYVKYGGGRLRQLVRQYARARFFGRMRDTLMTKDDMEELARVLSSASSPPEDDSNRMNYDAFCIARENAPERAQRLFAASTFAKFRRDEHGRVSIPLFYDYAFQTFNYENDRLALTLYDGEGKGYLTEEELEAYVRDQVLTMEGLPDVQDKFLDFYVHTAVRKLAFFLESSRPGRIPINELLRSAAFEEFSRLRSPELAEDTSGNWFTHGNAMRVYRQYLDLDMDHNGMLTARELRNYAMGSFTWAFIQRVFEEHHTYSGEMDYRNFLDFVLAVENMGTKKGLKYMWRVLDVQGDGRLTRWTVNYFFRDIVARMKAQGEEPVNVEDVGDEIFDMVRPRDPRFITLEDLLACGVGDTVVRMLVDVKGFLDYDNRENMLHEEEEEWDAEEVDPLAHLPPGERARVELGLIPPPAGVRPRRKGAAGAGAGGGGSGMQLSAGGSREV